MLFNEQRWMQVNTYNIYLSIQALLPKIKHLEWYGLVNDHLIIIHECITLAWLLQLTIPKSIINAFYDEYLAEYELDFIYFQNTIGKFLYLQKLLI